MRAWAMLSAGLVVVGLGAGEARACPLTDAVQGWYARYLHRPVDSCGLNNWVGQLRSGVPAEQVQAAILGSDEFYQAHGSCPRGFVAGLYTDVLGRPACEAEIAQWTCQLARCGCRTDLARSFLCSARTELAQQQFAIPAPSYAPPAYPPIPAPAYQPAPTYAPPPAVYAPTYSVRPARYVPVYVPRPGPYRRPGPGIAVGIHYRSGR